MSRLKPLLKRPDAKLDFVADFTDYLEQTVDTLDSYEVIADEGLTVEDEAVANGVRLWVSGGEHGRIYHIKIKIVTNGYGGRNREDSRLYSIKVWE